MTERRLPPSALFAGLLAALFARMLGLDLASQGVTVAACAAIAVFGLPHGSFDLQLIQRERSAGRSLARLAVLYIGCAGAMFLLWQVSAVTALVLFLGIAVIHFAEDWPDTGSAFLSTGLAAALLSAPAFLNGAALLDIFSAMTAGNGAAIADGLILVAPMAAAVGMIAIVTLMQAGRSDLAGGAAAALVAMVALPPAVGFALFFCLGHSPRHFAANLDKLEWHRASQWLPVAVPLTGVACAAGAGLFLLQAPGAMSDNLVAATFILLSMLTVPHMAVPLLVARRPVSSSGARLVPMREG